jgi:hypothetical protein
MAKTRKEMGRYPMHKNIIGIKPRVVHQLAVRGAQ